MAKIPSLYFAMKNIARKKGNMRQYRHFDDKIKKLEKKKGKCRMAKAMSRR